MTDQYANIRRALKMGPSKGPWKAIKRKNSAYFERVFRDGWELEGPTLVPDYETTYYCEQDAAYIAAAHPETIRALLAERDALREALESVIYDMRLRAGIRGDVENGVAVLDISDGVLEQVRVALGQEQGEA